MNDSSNIDYLVEQSVRLLAVGEGDVKARLLNAYTQRLQYVFPEYLPIELQPLLTSIRKRLNKTPSYKDQSTVQSALYKMHRKTASRIANDVVELQLALVRFRSR